MSKNISKDFGSVDLLKGTRRVVNTATAKGAFISGDGGNDGPLEDMWRYGIDAASMDWLGNGDHDNGNGREYTWWLTQKTTDAFYLPKAFTPMFSYERSVSYPEGHRNVVFAQRGVRTLPRLPISDARVHEPAPDTNMLYKYLKKFDGVCASHTSVGSMGTDWRDNDPVVEPLVEIYQGDRNHVTDYLTGLGWDVTARSVDEAHSDNGFQYPDDELSRAWTQLKYVRAVLSQKR